MSRWPASLALCLAALLTAVGQASGQVVVQPIAFRIVSVLAANTNEGVDPRLQALGGQLQSLFPYSTYRLLDRQKQRIPCGRDNTFSLPGGRILHLEPHSIEGGMIAMHLMLFQGGQPMMTTDIKLANHGVFMVGGPRYQNGWLIVSIAADASSPKMAAPEQLPAPLQPAATHLPSMGPTQGIR